MNEGVEAGASAPSEAEVPSSRAWLVTVVATSTMAISYLDRQVLAVLAPTITAALVIDDTQYGWLQSAFSIAYLACSPFAGRMLERVGIRTGLLAAVVVWTFVSAGHALAGSFAALFALRLALGAAESPSFPGAAAAIARTQAPGQRARAIGILFTTSPLFAFSLLWGSKLLHDRLGVPQSDVGRYLWLPPLLYDLGSIAFGHLASVHARDRGANSTPVVLVLVAAALASTLVLVTFAETPWQVVVTLGVAMAGGAGLFAILTAEMIRGVGPTAAATAGGATASAQSLTYVIANPAIGAAVGAFHGYDPVIVVIASLVIPGALLWIRTAPRSSL